MGHAPWYENIAKRQVKPPKVYLRDSGPLHHLRSVSDLHSLLGHPRVGASWEGFVLEEVLRIVQPGEALFWGTHTGAELDLLFLAGGQRYGVEIKLSEAPRVTRAMRSALEDLHLAHLWVVYPGQHTYPVQDIITVLALRDIVTLATRMR